MERFLSPLAKKLDPYVPGEQPKDMGNLIKLNTNENPYNPPKPVFDAIMQEAVNLRLYPNVTSEGLRKAIAENEGVGIDEVFLGNGADEVLSLCIPAFFSEYVRVTDITYSFYKSIVKLFNVKLKQIPLKEDFSVDTDEFCKESDCGIILTNPNAPTGIALGVEEIKRILDCNSDNVVIIDETYVNYGAKSVVPLIREYPNLLVVRTFSKYYALAGLRVGFAIGQKHLLQGLIRAKDSFNSYPLDRIAQAGAIAAVKSKEYYNEITSKIIATREKFSNELEELGFYVLKSSANFVFAKPRGKSAVEIMEYLRVNNILVRHFDEPRISDFLRISIGTPGQMDKTVEVLERLFKQ